VRAALSIARERKLGERVSLLLLDEARVLMETGRYVEAGQRLDEAIDSRVSQEPSELLIERARIDARLGDVDRARDRLGQARALPESMAGDAAAAPPRGVAYAARPKQPTSCLPRRPAQTDDRRRAAWRRRESVCWTPGRKSSGRAATRPAR
jgi:hypothetical protein